MQVTTALNATETNERKGGRYREQMIGQTKGQ